MRLVVVFACLLVATAWAQPTIQFEWISVQYDWPNDTMRDEWISLGWYVPNNNVITGVKYYNGDYYVTVPRWRQGVPSTLNKLVTKNGSHLLQPYPSWEMNMGFAMNGQVDYSKIQYVQSMEIDLQGRMWIVDVGRLNIFDASNPAINGPPKLVIYDMNAQTVLRTFVFDNVAASYSGSFLNDIVLDLTNGFAYMSNTWGRGGVLIYNYNTNQARMFTDVTTQSEYPLNPIRINGTVLPINNPSDGIALSPDTRTLYYCALSGVHLYAVPTSVLQNFTLSDSEIAAQVTNLGVKSSQSDGLAMTSNGIMYFGRLSDPSGLGRWDTSMPLSTQTVVASDPVNTNWIDTFAFDNANQALIFTSNRLSEYFFNTMDFSGASGANMRVLRLPIGTTSYLTAQGPAPTPAAPVVCDECSDSVPLKVKFEFFGIGAGVGIVVLSIVICAYRWSASSKKGNSRDNYHLQM